MSVSTPFSSSFSRLDDTRLSQAAVLIPLLAGLVAPSTPSWALLFYLTAIPALAWKLWRGWRPDFRNPALAAMLLLWGWSALTIIWDHDVSGHGKSQIFWMFSALFTLVFMLNFVSAQEEQPKTRDRAMAALIYGAAANAILSLGLFVIKGDFVTRLWGWGISGNPVMGAAIMDIGLLLALSRGAADAGQRWKMAAAAVPMIGFLAVSYSRTALLAMAAALLLIALGRRPLLAVLTALIMAAAAAVLWKFGSVLFPMLWENLASRGSDCHAVLWRAAWQAILNRPLIGFGPSATLPNMGPSQPYCPPYPSPHSLYLSILLYSGAIGLVLFVTTIALLWRHLRHATEGFSRRVWLGLGLVPLIVGISDLVQILKGPSPMWYILWMPMLLVLTLPVAQAGTASAATGR
jgi:O-antigen ligase